MTKAARWAWSVALVATTGVVLVLAFVLSLAMEGDGTLERHFVWLFWLNVAVAVLLAMVVGFVAVRLVVRVQRRKFGSRLLMKLAGIFALVGLLPGIVIYTVSYQFVSRSLEVWFDAKVAGALDAGLALGRDTLESMQTDLAAKTKLAAERFAEGSLAMTPIVLERIREQIGAEEVVLVGSNGHILVTAGAAGAGIVSERPAAALMRQARATGVTSLIEGLDEETLARAQSAGGGARLRALAKVPRRDVALAPSDDQFLMVVQPISRGMAVNALAVQAAYSDYQQRALARDSLRRMYIGTLTLALVLAVFGAVLLAILLGTQIARPLLLLADGVSQVAAGDLTDKPVFASADELGGLTRSFADMTRQLAEAREEVQRGVLQLEGARTRLQTILDTLSAGVIVLDRHGHIDIVNPGATRILRLPLSAWRGRRLDALPELESFAASVRERFELLATSPEEGERDHWQESIEFKRGDGTPLTLLVRGALLPSERTPGGSPASPPTEGNTWTPAAARVGAAQDAKLLVFDDISEVISAQRSAAWAEVARRLAHEIKNPLTPIQLSAQRLQHKLESRLEGPDRALLLRGVATIVAQVAAMQTLVNEFRDYARLPAAEMKPLDLSALVTEVLALYAEKQEHGQLVARAAHPVPAILGDATQLRQVIHNLVQNSLDAVADREGGLVQVVTSAATSESGEPREVRLTIIDNGHGFAEKILKRAAEPYVTTKAKGTGLGLAVVKKIADEHGARFRVANLHARDDPDAPVIGARVSLSFPHLASAAAVQTVADATP
ncbi:MAG: HAMP domain-containing protein [Rubrivivax sp.]|nr:HAMP domain-containing protein [Rubrivivax sp.]